MRQTESHWAQHKLLQGPLEQKIIIMIFAVILYYYFYIKCEDEKAFYSYEKKRKLFRY